MEPITLTKAAVIAAGRAAYLEGRLSAQGPTPACRYRDASGRPCIIGAALDDETAAEWDRSAGLVGRLWEDGLLKTRSLNFLEALQSAHDCWAASPDNIGDEARLCKLLGLPAPVKP